MRAHWIPLLLAGAAGLTSAAYCIADCETIRGAKYDTGFLPSVLQAVWNKYSGPENTLRGTLPRSKEGYKRIVYFYSYLMWIHRGHDKGGTGWDGVGRGRLSWFAGITDWCFKNQVQPVGGALAAIIDEITQESRMLRDDLYNHAPFFRHGFRAIVDTFPVYVTQPTTWANAQLLWQPKYKR